MLNLILMPPSVVQAPCGVFVLGFEENYQPRLLHATMRQMPVRSPRRTEHAHDVYHIVLVTNGRGTFLMDGREQATRRGDLHLISPGQAHCFEAGPAETTEYCEVTFQFVTGPGRTLTMPFPELMARWSGWPDSASTSGQAPPELYALIIREIGKIVQACQRAAADTPLLVNQALAQLFHGLLTHWFHIDSGRRHVPPLEQAYQYIQAHYPEAITLGDLAALTRWSRNYLSRAFKARYGVTPIYHQHQLRIQAAKTLLQTTHYPLKRIAELTGFCDEHYFSRVFRQQEGLPPHRYRRQLTPAARGGAAG